MPSPRIPAEQQTQLPADSAVFLDHVGHFVEDQTAAAEALKRAGFAPTPVSVQVNRDPGGGPPRLTGTGNVCAMLRRGYVEVLFKTAETPLGAEFDMARARYSGLHLVAFAVADADATYERLAGAGFAMQPVVKMQRPVETAEGAGVAAFEVVRLQPGQMPEGRVQMLRHRTEESVWQPRWLDHPNGATGLAALTVVVEDFAEAAARFERFTGRQAIEDEMGKRIRLDRGELVIATRATWLRRWPDVPPPGLPFMGECEIEVSSLAVAEHVLRAAGLSIIRGERASNASLSVHFPSALGRGIWTFREAR